MTTRPVDPETANGGAVVWRERLFDTLQRRGAIVVLLLVVVASALAFDNFFTAQNLQNIVLQGAFLGLIAVGMTFVIISGGIDLSVGSMIAMGGVLAAQAVQVSWPLALILPPLLCGLIGFGNGLLIAKAKMAPFIVTLAGLLGIRGLALALAGEKPIGISGESPFTWFGQGQVFGIAVPIVFMVVAFAVGGLVLSRTSYGQVIFAIGGSEESARLMGLPVNRTKVIAYTVSGLLAGLSGALLAARLSAGDPNAGLAWELDAISAVVVGGTLLTGGAGTISGTFAGVLLLSILQNLINQVGTLGSYTQQLLSGLFLIVVVLAQAFLTRRRIY
jgi:ribose/xylose/arabinose/galactoside ABC-type transport system permease subunit